MSKLTYFLSECKTPGFVYELTCSKNGGNREVVSRWPDNKQDHFTSALGLAFMKAIQSKHDYGNHAQVVVEVPICSIVDPMINI